MPLSGRPQVKPRSHASAREAPIASGSREAERSSLVWSSIGHQIQVRSSLDLRGMHPFRVRIGLGRTPRLPDSYYDDRPCEVIHV